VNVVPENVREIAAILGLLVTWSGIVAVWTRMRYAVDTLKTDVDALRRRLGTEIDAATARHTECSKLQAERFQLLLDRLNEMRVESQANMGEVRTEIRETRQKLEDFIQWRKNGGSKDA